MLDFGDSTILEIHNPEYFNETFEVSTSKHGFDVAFGLVGWGESEHEGDISTYGELKAFYKRWGNEGDPPGTNYFEIKTRPCTREELGLGDDPAESRFYPITGFSEAFLEDYWDILQCFDDDIVIRGSFQTYSAQSLAIQFVACDYINNSTCKSHEEIREFMRRRFVLTYENSQIFKSDKYDHRKITKESKFVWHQMRTTLKEESALDIHFSNVAL